MLTFWGVVTAFSIFGGIPTVGGLWMFERWRSRRRNENGECAVCGTSWPETRTGERYLIHGRLVCDGCAEKARGRLLWQFGILGAAAAAAGTSTALAGGSAAMILLVPIGLPIVMTVGVVQWMKRANRDAQRRIAAGEFPDLVALDGDPRSEELDGLPAGPAL